jgi:hypothetical protein
LHHAIHIAVQADGDKFFPPMRPVRSPRRTVWRNTCATWQHRVTRLVAVAVIDALEVVHVHHERMRRHGLAGVEIQLQRIVQPTAVEQLRHRVTRCQIAQLIGQPAQHQPDDGWRQHRREERHVDIEHQLEIGIHLQRSQSATQQFDEFDGIEHADAEDQGRKNTISPYRSLAKVRTP